jgi:hypothetical protein
LDLRRATAGVPHACCARRPTWPHRLAEDPDRRDGGGVYSQDHVLDVVVTPAGRLTLKDEDELAAAVAQGRYDCSDAEQFARDAEAAEALVAARGWPFCEPWSDWRPDPLLPVAELPADASWDIDLTTD